MKKLLLSTVAVVALTISASAQNPTTYSDEFDSTAVEPAPCFISWATGFTWQYNPGGDITKINWDAANKQINMDVTTVSDPTLHGPLYYKLTSGTRAACGTGAGAGLVDVTTNNKFSIRMKASEAVQVIVYVQEGNAPSWNYSLFSNSNITADLTTEWQVFTLNSILDSNQAKTASIDLSQIGIVAFELGKTDGTNYDPVTGATVSVDYIKFGEAVLGVEDVEAASAVKVYPNPATDVVNVTVGSANSNVTLSDVTGKVVASGSGSGTVVLNTANIPAGLYIASVSSAAGVTTAKVVVK